MSNNPIKILGVIPARYASTRFPAKALAMIGDKPMIRRVYEQAAKSRSLARVVVATDHEKIFEAVKEFGGEAVMTRADHPSGTDRCYEALTLQHEAYDYVINIQGDEPFIKPEQIDQAAALLDGRTELATLVAPVRDQATLFNPNIVKVIFNNNDEALYFSRQCIPYLRGVEQEEWIDRHTFYKHVSIYAYRTDVLGRITQLPVSRLEKAESLEQLRWLENGYRIRIGVTEFESMGVDTPEDLEKAIKTFL